MNFASKLSFLWLVHPLCSLGYRFVPSTGRLSTLPRPPIGREGDLWGTCFTKNKKNFTQTHKRPRQTQKAPHQTPTSPPAPLPWGEGSMLHKKQKALTQTHKKPRTKTKSPHTNPQKPRQTQKAPHQPHKRPRPKTKSPSQPHKRPRPKTKSPHQNHKKAPPPQRPKPHHPMKCEKGAWRSHVPFSHFGGGWGDWSPHKKKLGRRYRIEIMIK